VNIPYFHLTIVGSVDVQRYMAGIKRAQPDLLHDAGMTAVKMFCQA
jgi:hypothetical protein